VMTVSPKKVNSIPRRGANNGQATKKARNLECRSGRRSLARDCEGMTRSTHVFQINYQHSGIRRGIEHRYMTGGREGTTGRMNGYAGYGEDYRGDVEHYKHAIVFVHPLCHAHRKLRSP